MANPTTNFGWQMPEPTDLVTDLPADFEVFGQAVDTDFVDLLGGTTGQVLAKASNADLDFVWSADAAGMTNPMTTTGDSIYSSSGSTPARLGIGSAGQVLTVASGLPSWQTPTATTPTVVGCQVYKTGAAQTLTNGTGTAITFNAESFDTDAFHNLSTNTDRLTVPAGKAGYYLFFASIMFDGSGTGQRTITLLKNGAGLTGYAQTRSSPISGGYMTTNALAILNLAVADYVSITGYQNSGGDLDIMNDGNVMSLTYLGV